MVNLLIRWSEDDESRSTWHIDMIRIYYCPLSPISFFGEMRLPWLVFVVEKGIWKDRIAVGTVVGTRP